MAPVTDTPTVKSIPRHLMKAMRALLLPLKRRVANHDEHIRHLLATSKEMRRELDAVRDDLARLKQRVKWSEEA